MISMKVTKATHPEVVKVALSAFPSYRGRKFRVRVTDKPLCINDTYWSGGSRSQYVFVRLADMLTFAIGDPISGGFAPNANAAAEALRSVNMPAGIVCVEHRISCGKDTGLTVMIRPENVTPLLGEEVKE